ncbi:DUF6090 family protein [Flavobacteriaceae bacterium S0825]|uniref:DUF6090 family protein n=1 Tax=Gaetbulibacter sp. S0825 TaxID=2720084 RepID=UPI0014307232|nr:DUF6090 family protein [Gaetbulibacter sp. S0825]MCK0110376.1 DUF6090 family protein [Flavobacteriaceae bacterium S0825]NIX66005.1 hypothetical protein [Gaetbulibacter sp. S0825]
MIKFFRKIRYNLMETGKTGKYFKYAIGEIILVMIGILLALQVNNWNENKKTKHTEVFVLKEVLNNLNEDATILNDIINQRLKTKVSIANMLVYLQEETINKDTLEKDLVNYMTFERYFPINNAYEILKSKGLQLSNNSLTTKISRYYDFEQKKINRSILDVENAILNVLENPSGIIQYVESIELNKKVSIINSNDPNLKHDLNRNLVAFKHNNIGTLDKLIVFNKLNKSLRNSIETELKLIGI